ncbi:MULTISPECIES: hypothetical protein [unclassified Acinetobacter]|nr:MULTISPECIES: hypothetical protein [unclassified Acinetobacter]
MFASLADQQLTAAFYLKAATHGTANAELINVFGLAVNLTQKL